MQLNRITKHDSSIAMGEQGRMHACTVYSNVREIGEGISAVMLWIVYAMRMIILQYGYGMEYGGTDIAMARITSSSHGNQVQDLRSMLMVANFPNKSTTTTSHRNRNRKFYAWKPKPKPLVSKPKLCGVIA